MPEALTKKKSAAVPRPAEWKLRRARGLQILEAPALAEQGWLVHGFSTRPGGASELPASPGTGKSRRERVLNLGFTDWDTRARVVENRGRFFRAIGAEQ